MFDMRRISRRHGRPATWLPAGCLYACFVFAATTIFRPSLPGASPCATAAAPAAPAEDDATKLRKEVDRQIDRLSADDFAARDDARRVLTMLLSDPTRRDPVIALLAPRIVDKRLSFDVRATLRSIVPVASTSGEPISVPAASPPTAVEIAAAFAELTAESFEARDRAATQLGVAAGSPEACGLVLEKLLDPRLAEPTTVGERRKFTSLWTTAWRTWLTSESKWRPAAPDAERLAKLVEAAATEKRIVAERRPAEPEVVQIGGIRIQAAQPAAADEAPVAVALSEPTSAVERELLLLLACDEYVAAVSAALQKRLADPNLSADGEARLSGIYAWVHPAMAAEFWQDGRHSAVQHLLIGVPNQPLNAPRPSLFDFCDEKRAHCVSGNTLATGDHPVGIFFPHPSEIQPSAQFHLVNLPTPRRRMIYELTVPTGTASPEKLEQHDRRRRAAITARTVEYLLAQKRLLTVREIDMLQYLDPKEASRLAEPYLLGIADDRYDSGSPQAFGNGSLHGWFCYNLTLLGTPEAGRAIAAAIDKRRILEPTREKPYRIDVVTALYLAETAPWSGVDTWLAAQVDRTDPIRVDRPDAADVGASAAALLARRHDGNLNELGLESRPFDELTDLENPAYRFQNTESRAKFKQWWSLQNKK